METHNLQNGGDDAHGSGRLSDVAYRRILEALFDGRLPAGAFVSQSALAELTEVPVGPLRDALRVLEAEGVLAIQPRSGIQFVKPGLELTRNTYQFRGIIESAAMERFAETAPDDFLDELLEDHQLAISEVGKTGLSTTVVDELESLEQRLHGSIVASLNNPLIDSSYRRVHNYLRLLRLERRISKPQVSQSLGEHVSIISACKDRDAAAAVSALQAHFAAAIQRYLGLT